MNSLVRAFVRSPAALGLLDLRSVEKRRDDGRRADADGDPGFHQLGPPFVVTPYVQLGDTAHAVREEALTVMWHAAPNRGNWSVVFRSWMPPMPDWTFTSAASAPFEPGSVGSISSTEST